jgi:hypothetical protein
MLVQRIPDIQSFLNHIKIPPTKIYIIIPLLLGLHNIIRH